MPHSEYKLTQCIATELVKEGILVEYVTTDGDSGASRGMIDVYKDFFFSRLDDDKASGPHSPKPVYQMQQSQFWPHHVSWSI